MINAKVKGVFTVDMDRLEDHRPDDPLCFEVVVRLLIGPAGAEGEESFDISVATPKWLSLRCEKEGFVLGTHHVFVRNYDPQVITETLTRLVERHSGHTWLDVANQLRLIGSWEFESYRAADGENS